MAESRTLLVYSNGKQVYKDAVGTLGLTDAEKVDRSDYWPAYLTECVIGDSVTGIGANCFRGCDHLLSCIIPSSVQSLGTYCFSSCSSLASIELPIGITDIPDGSFNMCASLNDIVIPDGVTSIGIMAFPGCSSLRSITIPDSVTSIGSSAFQYNPDTEIICKASTPPYAPSAFFRLPFSLCQVAVPADSIPVYQSAPGWKQFLNYYGIGEATVLTYTGGRREYRTIIGAITSTDLITLDGLMKCEIGNLVNQISAQTFKNCTSLLEVEIPNTVRNIEDEAFYGCVGVEKIICRADIPPSCGTDVFESVDTNAILRVPNASVSLYRADATWGRFLSIIGLNDVIVLFNFNFLDSPSPVSRTYESGDKIGKFPYIERSGKTLGSWTNSQTGGSLLTENSIVNEDMTAYAQWRDKARFVVGQTLSFGV